MAIVRGQPAAHYGFLYPQKLCISLWTSAFFKVRFPAEIAFLLQWLIIDQPICP
jgi:hypothetical protein